MGKYWKAWYEKNKEKHKFHTLLWYQKNRKRIIQKQKEWYQANKTRALETSRKWRLLNKERYKELCKRANARARIRKANEKWVATPYNPDKKKWGKREHPWKGKKSKPKKLNPYL